MALVVEGTLLRLPATSPPLPELSTFADGEGFGTLGDVDVRWRRPGWRLSWRPKRNNTASTGDGLSDGFMVQLCGVKEEPSSAVGTEVSLERKGECTVVQLSGTDTVVSSVHALQLRSDGSMESAKWFEIGIRAQQEKL
jgi:hypothetical protein